MVSPYTFKHLNICVEMDTEEMIMHLRKWADCEEKHGARHRARQWRIVADRFSEMNAELVQRFPAASAGHKDDEVGQ